MYTYTVDVKTIRKLHIIIILYTRRCIIIHMRDAQLTDLYNIRGDYQLPDEIIFYSVLFIFYALVKHDLFLEQPVSLWYLNLA